MFLQTYFYTFYTYFFLSIPSESNRNFHFMHSRQYYLYWCHQRSTWNNLPYWLMEQVNLKGTFLRFQILYLSSIVHDVHHEATCRSTTKSHAQIRLCEKQSKYFVGKWRCFKTPLYKNMHMSANVVACAIFWFLYMGKWKEKTVFAAIRSFSCKPSYS